MTKLSLALVAAIALGAAITTFAPASAMPVGGLTAAIEETSSDLQDVRWCYRYHRHCHWRGWYYRHHHHRYYRY
jgi:sterol desaturase/sphingolipid hydroxylase (fatty acid hydroxylase superfamily)